MYCVSAYDDKATFEAGGESHDTDFATKDEAVNAFNLLVKGRKFYAVAYGYIVADGEYIDVGEWTADDPA